MFQAIFSDIDGDGSKAISKDEFIREMTKKNRQYVLPMIIII